jgi:hypothetical protein
VKVAPHTWPELSTLGTGFTSLRRCSKLLKPPKDVKKHPLENNRNREIRKILVMLTK